MSRPLADHALVSEGSSIQSLGRASMNIMIDALPFLGDGGITSYVRGLVHALLALDDADRYELLFRTGSRARRAAVQHLRRDPDLAAASFRCLPVPDGIVERVWRLGRWAGSMVPRASAADVFFATLLIAPQLDGGRVVPLVFDLIPLRFPQWYGADARRLERRLIAVAPQAAVWMAISEATRSDLHECLGIPTSSIRVVHPGVDREFEMAPVSLGERARLARHGIEGPYLLYVGGYGPHKNVETLLQAWSLVRAGRSRRCQLVLAGPGRWASERITTVDPAEGVRFLGYVPREELALLYRGAELFVTASLDEGFGLPALEAMACGTPVVVSCAGALPEVVGDGGELVEPHDAEAIAATITSLLEDEVARSELAERGRRQASRFRWSDAARAARAVFAEAVER